MTGFGDAAAEHQGVRYSVEIRSVNNRFLKTVLRMPERLGVLEPWLESKIRDAVQRGTVTVTIGLSERDASMAHIVNAEVLRHYAQQLSDAAGGEVQINPGSLVNLPGVLTPPVDLDHTARNARAALEPLLKEALGHLVSMREREGHGLRADLCAHLEQIRERVERVSELSPGVAQAYETRLRERLTKLLDELQVRDAQPADIVREVAVFAEKTDIAEEIARLKEHLRHFDELLGSEDPRPIGRTLDFLAQELLREANTIASKTPDAEISRLIVDVKGAIDRIKEQVQNAE